MHFIKNYVLYILYSIDCVTDGMWEYLQGAQSFVKADRLGINYRFPDGFFIQVNIRLAITGEERRPISR